MLKLRGVSWNTEKIWDVVFEEVGNCVEKEGGANFARVA